MPDLHFRIILIPERTTQFDDDSGAEMFAAAVEGDERELERESESLIVLPVAELSDRCVTTGWEETLGVSATLGLSPARRAAEIRDYLVGSGWWDEFCAVVEAESGFRPDARALDEAVSNLHQVA